MMREKNGLMKLVRLCALICCSSFLFGAATSFTDEPDYTEFCERASENMDLFANFKKHPMYTTVVEHVTFTQGKEYLSLALHQTPQFVNLMESFRKNDRIGDPQVFSYDNFGFFSPTTLRYIKVASDLQVLFGSLDDKDIIEIGGGCGGQCVILAALFKYKSYTIVDLPGPLALIKKYLEAQGITNVSLITEEELPRDKTYDLVISNYAFSECFRKTQEVYLSQILFQSKLGYLTCNNDPLVKRLFSKQELIDALHSHGIYCQESREIPLTGPNNYCLTWAY